MIQANARFGKVLERTITGWEGNPAPAFAVKAYDGSDLNLGAMAGKPFPVALTKTSKTVPLTPC